MKHLVTVEAAVWALIRNEREVDYTCCHVTAKSNDMAAYGWFKLFDTTIEREVEEVDPIPQVVAVLDKKIAEKQAEINEYLGQKQRLLAITHEAPARKAWEDAELRKAVDDDIPF